MSHEYNSVAIPMAAKPAVSDNVEQIGTKKSCVLNHHPTWPTVISRFGFNLAFSVFLAVMVKVAHADPSWYPTDIASTGRDEAFVALGRSVDGQRYRVISYSFRDNAIIETGSMYLPFGPNWQDLDISDDGKTALVVSNCFSSTICPDGLLGWDIWEVQLTDQTLARVTNVETRYARRNPRYVEGSENIRFVVQEIIHQSPNWPLTGTKIVSEISADGREKVVFPNDALIYKSRSSPDDTVVQSYGLSMSTLYLPQYQTHETMTAIGELNTFLQWKSEDKAAQYLAKVSERQNLTRTLSAFAVRDDSAEILIADLRTTHRRAKARVIDLVRDESEPGWLALTALGQSGRLTRFSDSGDVSDLASFDLTASNVVRLAALSGGLFVVLSEKKDAQKNTVGSIEVYQ